MNRLKINLSVKLLNNQVTDDEAKTDSFDVEFFVFVFDWAKQLEKLRLILLSYAKSGVFNFDFYEVFVFPLVLFYVYINLATKISKFNGVGKEVQENLLEALLVSFNQELFSKVVILYIHL